MFLEKKLDRKNCEEPAVTNVESISQRTITPMAPPVVLQMSGNPQKAIPSIQNSEIIQSNSSLQISSQQATIFSQNSTQLACLSSNTTNNIAQLQTTTSSKGW